MCDKIISVSLNNDLASCGVSVFKSVMTLYLWKYRPFALQWVKGCHTLGDDQSGVADTLIWHSMMKMLMKCFSAYNNLLFTVRDCYRGGRNPSNLNPKQSAYQFIREHVLDFFFTHITKISHPRKTLSREGYNWGAFVYDFFLNNDSK